MVDMLRERGAGHIRVFGGGGGTITPEEINELAGLRRRAHLPPQRRHAPGPGGDDRGRDAARRPGRRAARARLRRIQGRASMTRSPSATCSRAIEEGKLSDTDLDHLRKQWKLAGKARRPCSASPAPAAPASRSVVDELLLRFLHAFPQMRIAVLAVDPTRRRSGGALLGDRIRMNALRSHRVYMRSMATRRQHAATNEVLHDCIDFLQGAALRPGDRRDRRHRPERFGNRRSRRLPGLRDDQRLRRRQPAREDRHDRFRRARRAQQVRQARRRRCAARRAQAVEAQPHRLQPSRTRTCRSIPPSPASSTTRA